MSVRTPERHQGAAAEGLRRRNIELMARTIATELAPHARSLDLEPAQLARSYAVLRAEGYLAAAVPSALGGGGASLVDLVGAQRTIAAACSNTALAVNMHLFQVGALADRWHVDGGGEALLRSVAERGTVLASTTGEAIGLDPFTTSTTAHRSAGGYRINGRKHFCSQAGVMDLLRVLATDDANRLVLAIVPASAPGLTVVEPPLTMGMRGTQSFDIVLDDVDVDDDAIALRLEGSVPLLEPSIAAGAVWFMLLLAGVYAGVADGAAAEALRLRRAGRPTGRIELLRNRIDAVLDHGFAQSAHESDPIGALASAAATKENVISSADELVDECVAIAGSAAFSTASRLEQSVRDVRAGRHHPPDRATTLELLAMSRSSDGELRHEPAEDPR